MDHRALYLLMSAPLLAFAAQSGVSSSTSPATASPRQQQAEAPLDAARPDAQSTRRSRMVEPEGSRRPTFHLTAVFIENEPDVSTKDNCLKNTGTRLKREDSGNRACTSGNGVVYRMP